MIKALSGLFVVTHTANYGEAAKCKIRCWYPLTMEWASASVKEYSGVPRQWCHQSAQVLHDTDSYNSIGLIFKWLAFFF